MSGATTVALFDDITLDEDLILVNPQTGLPIYQWLQLSPVRGKVLVSYDFNVPGIVTDDYGIRRLFTATTSVTTYGAEQPIEATYRGVRTSLNGAQLVDDQVAAWMQYFGQPALFLAFSTCYISHILERLQEVRITHALIANRITGQMGLAKQRFLLMNVTPVFGIQGRVDFLAMWVQAIETSVAPTGLSAGLGGPTVFFDDSDVSVPFASSADITTATGASTNVIKVRIKLKMTGWRWWTAKQEAKAAGTPPEGGYDCATGYTYGQFNWNDYLYNTSITYKIEYKTTGAPNSPGSGGNPTTGWVELLAPTVRGNTNFVTFQQCHGQPTDPTPGFATTDFWTLDFLTLGASPNAYNFRVHFQSLSGVTLSNTVPGVDVPDCFDDLSGLTCPSVDRGATLMSNVATLTVDSLESLTA